jgi:hypothetical protein
MVTFLPSSLPQHCVVAPLCGRKTAWHCAVSTLKAKNVLKAVKKRRAELATCNAAIASSEHSDDACAGVRCAFSKRILHSRMSLVSTHVTNGIPLRSPLLIVAIINYGETLKANLALAAAQSVALKFMQTAQAPPPPLPPPPPPPRKPQVHLPMDGLLPPGTTRAFRQKFKLRGCHWFARLLTYKATSGSSSIREVQ